LTCGFSQDNGRFTAGDAEESWSRKRIFNADSERMMVYDFRRKIVKRSRASIMEIGFLSALKHCKRCDIYI
jgi:hypothetical protein